MKASNMLQRFNAGLELTRGSRWVRGFRKMFRRGLCLLIWCTSNRNSKAYDPDPEPETATPRKLSQGHRQMKPTTQGGLQGSPLFFAGGGGGGVRGLRKYFCWRFARCWGLWTCTFIAGLLGIH